MQRTSLRKLVTTCVGIAIIAASILSVVFIAKAKQNAPFVLTNQSVPLVSRAHMVEPADAQQQLNLSVGLQLRNQSDLASLLSDLNNPRSSRYHQYLTPQEFAAQFGPTADQVQQVKDYLQQQGLTVTSVAPNGLLVDATASVAQAEAAFRVTINNYMLGAMQYWKVFKDRGYVRAGYTFDTDRTPGGDGPVTPGIPTSGDWQYTGHRLSTGVAYQALTATTLQLAFDYYRQNYSNPNSFSPDLTVRKDNIYQLTGTAVRDLRSWLWLAFQYSYTRDQSNVDVFDYSRHIVSLTVGGSF